MDFNQNWLRPQAVAPGAQQGGLVLLYCPVTRELHQHERVTHTELARKLAALKGLEFGGSFDPAYRYTEPVYFVPSDTLLSCEAEELKVREAHNLFGGVVPHSFVATKTISHGLPSPDSPAPQGWSQALGEQIHQHVLPGYTAFSVEDVRRAATLLFKQGKVRIKLPDGIGGVGQFVVASLDELDEFLKQIDPQELGRKGIVAETNLQDVVTYSIGQSLVGDLLITYCGTQRSTASNHGKQVYGGSDLTVVRGDFEVLLKLDLDNDTRKAILQACEYHRAALECYPDIVVSRANYDVALGFDDSGQAHSGVLEQSWRIGGASAAEVLALEAFDGDASLDVVCTSTTELYGADGEPPAQAYVYYRGVDDKVGPLTKFAQIRDYAHLR